MALCFVMEHVERKRDAVNNNILCQREEQMALNGFFEEMLAMIQGF